MQATVGNRRRRATSVLKIATTETTFLPAKSTAKSQHARTLNERNKVGAASKMQLELNMPKVNTVDTNIVHCVGAFFLSFFFFFLFARIANVLCAFTQQLLPLPLRVS